MDQRPKPAGPQVGALTVVGTGMQAVGQLTIEAECCIKAADKLLYLSSDPVTERYLRELNSTAESIYDAYADKKDRFQSYLEMVDRIMAEVRQGSKVCAAFYGHPGVFVFPSHEVIRRARKEGYRARMLPGISAEDCLFADLGIDPGVPGCHSFEATDFLLFRRKFDPHSSLILWQVGVIGDLTFQAEGYENRNVEVLVEYLESIYGRGHRAIIYEASHFSIFDPRMEMTSVGQLPTAKLTAASTLYVPPLPGAKMDEDMLHRLGMKAEQLPKVELKFS